VLCRVLAVHFRTEENMKKNFGLALLSTALAGSAFGSISFVTSPLVVIDTVNWGNIGGDGTTFPTNQMVTSGLGNVTTIGLGTQPGLGGVTSVVCTAVNPVNCSWPHQPEGYNDGDTLLWLEGLDANGNPVGTGPLTLTLATSVFGMGAYIQSTSIGAFSATLAVYNGATLLGSQAYSSDSLGDPLFLGARDDMQEVTKGVFTVTACGSFQCDPNDFSVDTLDIFAAPEPSTFVLSGIGMLLTVGFAVRKRMIRGNK
jgi:PEP-CTERM motif